MRELSNKTVFILGISSDIGYELSRLYYQEGYNVIGTYRSKNSFLDALHETNIDLIQCDINDLISVKAAIEKYKSGCRPWDIFISSVGVMDPIGNFFKCDFATWEQSVIANSIAQLRFLHGMYPYRCKGEMSHACFFAGGGTNSTFTNYSAYCVSKIMLIKMCELLDDENDDLNVFIVGPGWVKTKIHEQTFKNSINAGINYQRTVEFLNSDITGTPTRDIYDCIKWCIDQGKLIASGRNFSVVNDKWRQGGKELAEQLCCDPNKFKLRRSGNS